MVVTNEESLEQQPKFRQLKGAAGIGAKVLLGAMPVIGTFYVLNVPAYLGVAIYKEQYLGLFLTLVLSSAFLVTPATKKAARDKLPWYDALLATLSFVVGGYIALLYPQLIPQMGYITLTRMILSAVTLLLIFEAVRRLFGWTLIIIGIIFVLYARFAYLFPGVLHAREFSWGRLLSYLYLDPGSLLGIPLAVAGIIVLSFIFFGRCLFATGGGQFLSDSALSLMGKYKGGPAKAAIVASGLFGTLSGSASANVATTGIITIPLMKRIGYKPQFAAAVEAVASTGGLIMPPVMAATAFIIAEFLEIPYPQVAIPAFIPAILYYIAIFVQVDREAAKEGLLGLPAQELPSRKKLIRQGWPFIIPVVVLVYCLFVLYLRPATSGIYAVGATLLISLFRKETRVSLGKLLTILVDTGRGLLDVGIVCALAGFIIGVVSLTGLGISLSQALVNISGGNVLVLLILAAIGSIILGMGMPITATYIMLAILIAPALIQLGIQPLAAHLFIMYFGALSFLTPPVCIAAYVAAGIAGSAPMRTGFQGVRLSIIAYIVPFVFAFAPSLLLMGSARDILLTVITTALGTILLATAFGGYLFGKLNLPKRIWLTIGAFGLLMPNLITDVIGLGIAIPLLLWQWRMRRAV